MANPRRGARQLGGADPVFIPGESHEGCPMRAPKPQLILCPRRAPSSLGVLSITVRGRLECITDEFNAFDREWRFAYLNAAALNSIRRVKGEALTREGVLGKNVWEMFPAHVGSIFYQKYHDAMREQKALGFERAPR